MQKVISLFKRDYNGTHLVYDEVVPGAEWVVAGEGQATIKWDGTSCRITREPSGEVILWKRYDLRQGRNAPEGFEPAQPSPDPTTGHWPGWIRCQRDNPNDRWHFEGLDDLAATFTHDVRQIEEGTYELVGPKIGNKGSGNPYGFDRHHLFRHGSSKLLNAPRTFELLRAYFIAHPAYEGIVWWHPDGRMVKIKRRDFGLPWPDTLMNRTGFALDPSM